MQYSMIVDVLDSLLLMGLEDEYARARTWVAEQQTFDVDQRFHAFEVCSESTARST
jgi:endoplasmic reticulum Man9GlcNAc2 1,2-alpha-mannosidase